MGRSGGALLVDAPTGSGKTVATLAALVEHAEAADHRVVYLVRTHAQEAQVLQEMRAIARRAERPILAVGLAGRQSRCLLLEGLAEMKGATAEEHGKLCADRKRATAEAFEKGLPFEPGGDLPEGAAVDLTDLDGCVYYARLLQTDVDALADQFAAKLPTPREFDDFGRNENLCPYELAKRLCARARVVTAPYAFFFHPRIRASLLNWLGVPIERVDLVVDEAHNLPDYLREIATVALPHESIRRARAEIADRGDFALPDGPNAGKLVEVIGSAVDQLIRTYAREDDGLLPPGALEDALLTELGGTSHRLDTWLGALATWGEQLRDERRKQRRLPRSWVHSVALSVLSWPQLEAPMYVKVATRSPRRTLEAYALDASGAAEPVRTAHLSVHLSGTLRPIDEYRSALGLAEGTRELEVPPFFPPEHRRIFYDPSVSTRYEDLLGDPGMIERIADRCAEVLEALPVRTAVFFPSFDLLERVLGAGLHAALPEGTVIESRRVSMGDLWKSIDGFKRGRHDGALLGVIGGRIAEGVDFPDDELEAVVIVGIPYPRPSARREALKTYVDRGSGRGWAYCVDAPAQRLILQALGRMIRSEHDRGIAVILDRRAPLFQEVLPGLQPLQNLDAEVRALFGRRAPRWTPATN
ncbi:MAG TPA: ATP-dependent DNA helicase [Thermoplasmata archaeon]|nr:ATP-dependent DNA helicase [Thermoplasmata archaeon]